MPLHFDAITEDTQNTEVLAWILRSGMEENDSVFVSADKFYFHIRTPFHDDLTGDKIGDLIYTVKRNEEQQVLEIIDLDIVLLSEEDSELRFLHKRSCSTDANEYYDVEALPMEQRLEIETVNRHTVPEEIEGTVRKVRVSVFPFELSVYEDIFAFNAWAGIDPEKEIANTGFKVAGFAETFSMPGGLMDDDKERNNYSFLLGKVVSFRDVRVTFGSVSYDFVLAKVHTALGNVPVAMGREVFDLSKLSPGVIVAMNADVKADVSAADDFVVKNKIK